MGLTKVFMPDMVTGELPFSMIEGAVINVLDYGAVGDGTTDDTAAIQAAVDANPNGTVFFPTGAYKVTDTITVEYNNTPGYICTNLAGAGMGSTIYWHGANNKPVITYKGVQASAGFNGKTTIEKLFFVNSIGASGSTGINFGDFGGPDGYLDGVGNVTVQDCKFQDFTIGISTEYESDNILITNNEFLAYGTHGIYNNGSAAMRITNNYFKNGSSGSIAVYCKYAAINVSDNLIQSSQTGITGGICLDQVGGFTVNNNYIEFPYSGNWGILCLNSTSGYIGSNAIQGLQGADGIYIDALSNNIDVGPNTYGFFGYPMASLVNSLSSLQNVNVSTEQSYVLSPVTISNGSPAVITSTSPGMQTNEVVYFTTTGSLPNGLTAGTPYYAIPVSTYSFNVAATPSGSPINTTSAGSGVHTCHITLANALDGTGYGVVTRDGYFLVGEPKWTAAPNGAVEIARTGAVNIGNNNGTNGWSFTGYFRNGVSIGSVTQAGTTGVAYNTTSDYRLKENVQPMQNALETVSKLKPVTYTWKSNGEDGQGFIAHELQAVVPDCVTGEKDGFEYEEYEIEPAVYEETITPAIKDKNGKEIFPAQTRKRLIKDAVIGKRKVPVYQGIDTSFLVATLTKAIQELKAEIDALKGAK